MVPIARGGGYRLGVKAVPLVPREWPSSCGTAPCPSVGKVEAPVIETMLCQPKSTPSSDQVLCQQVPFWHKAFLIPLFLPTSHSQFLFVHLGMHCQKQGVESTGLHVASAS